LNLAFFFILFNSFANFLYFFNINILQVTIIANTNKKNIPLVSPNDIVEPTITFIIVRTINNPNKIKIKDFEGIKKISFCLISNLVFFINKIEKSAPTSTDSIISISDKRNSGKRNIHAPELIKIGGKIIFFELVGFLAAFIRTNIIVVAIKTAMMELAVTKIVSFNSIDIPCLE